MLKSILNTSAVIMTCLFLLIGVCSFGQKKSDIASSSKVFVEALVKGDHNACLSQMNVGSSELRDSITRSLDEMKYRVMNEFGRDVQIKVLGYNEIILLLGSENARDLNENTKTAYVQIEDSRRFSVFQLTSDRDNHISTFGMLNTIYLKPGSTLWLIGIPVMLLIVAFNIYVIVKVYKSDVTKKWIKYLMIIFLNLPAIGYHTMSGVMFELLSLRVLGVGLGWGDYFNTYWCIGLPIGATIVLWRIKSNLYRTKDDDWIYHVNPDNG